MRTISLITQWVNWEFFRRFIQGFFFFLLLPSSNKDAVAGGGFSSMPDALSRSYDRNCDTINNH